MASLTTGTEIALIVAVAVSIVLAVSRLTRSAPLASPVPGSGFKDVFGAHGVPRALGRVLQPQGAALGPWLRQRFDTLLARYSVASNARIGTSVTTIAGARSTGVATPASCARTKRATTVAAQSRRLTADMQWDRVSRTIARAIEGVAQVRSAHGTAAIKLDAADYEFERLLGELGSVMKLRSPAAEVAEFPLTHRARGLRQGSARVAA